MAAMSFLSSPIAFPPSSSPAPPVASRKRAAPTSSTAPTKKKRLFSAEFVLSESVPAQQSNQSSVGKHQESVNHTTILGLCSNPFEEDEASGEEEGTLAIGAKKLQDAVVDNVTCATGIGAGEGCLEDQNRISEKCVTSNGKTRLIRQKTATASLSYEQLIAQKSTSAPGKAKTSYYGIEIHKILKEAKEAKSQEPVEEEAVEDVAVQSVETRKGKRKQNHTMWTEKYRARKFTDLVGDERTHRSVLRWLKSWDSVVFPGTAKPSVKMLAKDDQTEERAHRKILLLAGPPGLGKTTLAHVCARQAGYEVVEINASDERSREVVKGRIRDCVGTENVRGVNSKVEGQTVRTAGRPVCVVVDEVDGVVIGSGGSGEGGFIKALIDLVLLDQKNSKGTPDSNVNAKKTRKGDTFRLLRPMILVCNDVYHPSLKPLKSSGLAEILHVKKPPLEKIIARMKNVFEKEGVAVDNDGVRRLCEVTWGISSRKEGHTSSNNGEGDIRGVLVAGEWAACKLRSSFRPSNAAPRLTRNWVEKNLISDLSTGGSGARGFGRGGTKEVVDRIFLEGGGFPKTLTSTTTDYEAAPISLPTDTTSTRLSTLSATSQAKTTSSFLLRHLIDSIGDTDRLTSDLFTLYPSRPFQDDTFLSKPNSAYDWLLFHDSVSTRVHYHQDWELAPYLPQAALAFHDLFASSSSSLAAHSINSAATAGENDATAEPALFSGPRAEFAFAEAQRANLSALQSLHAGLSISLQRAFDSPQELAMELAPYVNRMLSPEVKPVVVGGSGEARGAASVRRESEREMVKRGGSAMVACGVEFERVRIEDEDRGGAWRGGVRGGGGWVWRMEP